MQFPIERPRRAAGCRRRCVSHFFIYGVGTLLTACGVSSAPGAIHSPPPAVRVAATAPARSSKASPLPGVPTSVPLGPRPPEGAIPHVQPTAARLAASGEASAADALAQLRRALELADAEMQASRDSITLQEAKLHAEAIVNILVGRQGRWYGDADRNGVVTDPSDHRGVLPGERAIRPDRVSETGGELLPGWGIAAYDRGDQHVRDAIQGTIIGDVDGWRVKSSAHYDEIGRAVDGSDLNRNLVSKLDGRAMRAVAWARLILTKAGSLDDAKAYAGHGAADIGAALDAVRAIN